MGRSEENGLKAASRFGGSINLLLTEPSLFSESL